MTVTKPTKCTFLVLLALALAGSPLGAAGAATDPAITVVGPYLQNPAADGMTVCFLGQGAAAVRVAMTAMGAPAGPREIAATGTAIPGTPWTVWKTRLKALQPGAAYSYQVRYQMEGKEQATPSCQFRTIDPQAKSLHVIAFNDLHNRDATLSALLRHVKPKDHEMSLLLGDCIADPTGKDGAREVIRAWNAYVTLLDGGSKPIVYVRGNHETRGDFAGRLSCLFDLPNLDSGAKWGEDQWQFTLRAGPVCFLAMDTGEDDDDSTPVSSYKNPVLWQKVRAGQAAWLKQVNADKIGRDAPWRVFLGHIPLYNSPYVSVRSRAMWAPLLHDFNPDLMLAGHDHTWRKTVPPTPDAPWPVLVGGGPAAQGGEEGTVMLLAADANGLKVRLLGARDGRELTTFTAPKPPAR